MESVAISFDKAVELALRTWYPADHPLHSDPHHPLGKLLGEWGELLDDYMKSIYKADYEFEPIDELGDIWYYTRVLAYQGKFALSINHYNVFSSWSTDRLIAEVMKQLAEDFCYFDEDGILTMCGATISCDALLELIERYNITLEQLTEYNWNKLKPGSTRGAEWTNSW